MVDDLTKKYSKESPLSNNNIWSWSFISHTIGQFGAIVQQFI